MISTYGIGAARRSEEARRRTVKTSSSASFASHLPDCGSVSSPAAIAGAAPIVSVDGLLGIQEVGDEGNARRQRAASYADDLLERLESLRIDLLSGRLPLDRLQGLVQSLRRREGGCGDERLDALIADIELRAEVEIAKLEMARQV